MLSSLLVSYLLTGPLHSPVFFFFNDTATTEIYTLSLHDALPISVSPSARGTMPCWASFLHKASGWRRLACRSEEHTSELQSRLHLVCRLLLEKKKIDSRSPATNPTTSKASATSNNRITSTQWTSH